MRTFFPAHAIPYVKYFSYFVQVFATSSYKYGHNLHSLMIFNICANKTTRA